MPEIDRAKLVLKYAAEKAFFRFLFHITVRHLESGKRHLQLDALHDEVHRLVLFAATFDDFDLVLVVLCLNEDDSALLQRQVMAVFDLSLLSGEVNDDAAIVL